MENKKQLNPIDWFQHWTAPFTHTLNILSFISFEYPTFISFLLCIFATFKATFERKVMVIARCAQTRRHRLFHF